MPKKAVAKKPISKKASKPSGNNMENRVLTKDLGYDKALTKEATHYDKYEGPLLKNIGYQLKDQIFAGEISEKLLDDDGTRVKNLVPVEVSKDHKNFTEGRNTSGCLWKKGTSTRTGNTTRGTLNKKTWDKRMNDVKKGKAL